MRRIFIISILGAAAAFSAACGTGGGNSAANNSAAGHNTMNHNSAANANHDIAHTGHDMPRGSAPGAASQPYDLQFIDSMIHHHQGAVDMAAMTLEKTKRDELKTFLRKMIDEQKKEIAQMREWRDAWYPGKPPALNMEMPGMEMSSHNMSQQAAAGKDQDVHFIEMMVPHHDGAVAMAREALQKAEHAEIKSLAGEIIRSQEAEIKMMQDWKAKWSV